MKVFNFFYALSFFISSNAICCWCLEGNNGKGSNYNGNGDTATDTSAIDISRPETFTSYGTGLGTNGMEFKTLHPGNGICATRVLDNGVKVWEGSGEEMCKFVEFYSKGGSNLLKLLIVTGGSSNTGNVYYEKVGDEWKNIKKGDDFNKKLEELKRSENNFSNSAWQESPESEEPTPAPDLKSKVDSSLFIVRESTIGISYLACTPKPDTNVTKLSYGDETIWDGSAKIKKSSYIAEALIYFDKEVPALVSIRAVKGYERSMVYRYNDGKQWKDIKKEDFDKKLNEIKE
ncbi:hypothetical protein BEWA_027320 [Theileria equi strain WA]|uniref:Signal peptide containing protein n=1 Tax=Theileria equi strain WA TaxID=1537102 RepID=L0AXC5_THEEQ|nr:hypothetical protein BEWA_027320 [Theileria equi strain WA]AFZ79883.1 hypothetical protein BEWA_027320 [Theileria equi strain WA]|eukprot:XP_004829549.1 hypothetical protein BEWA_027320 [Theileria equi strain WA]